MSIYHAKEEEEARERLQNQIQEEYERKILSREKREKKVYKKMTKFWNIAKQSFYSHSLA